MERSEEKQCAHLPCNCPAKRIVIIVVRLVRLQSGKLIVRADTLTAEPKPRIFGGENYA
jgi:hypothetical protein